MKKYLATIFTLLISLPILAADRLVINDAWTPQAPPGRLMAGFLELHNPGDQDVVLVDAESPDFDRVEIHTMVMVDGVMRMRRLDKLIIPAGETVKLEPGGLHLMMMGPEVTPGLGDALEITLIAEDDSRASFSSIIRPRRAPPSN